MRLAPLALLAALAPACLSGFSEIRVQGAGVDASSDRAPSADTAPRDTPEDRVQLADGGDAPTDVVVPVDLGAGDAAEADVVDGGAWDAGEDRTEPVDVQAVDAGDAGASADTPAAPDVVDGGTCPGGCTAGEVCEAGRCGRWRFTAWGEFSWYDYAQRPDAIDVAAEACRGAAGGAPYRVCRASEIDADTRRFQCNNRTRVVVSDPALVWHNADAGVYIPGCLACVGGAPEPTLLDGRGCGSWVVPVACCAFR